MWATVLGVVFLGLGVAMVWYGMRPLVVVPRLLRTAPVSPSAVSVEDGFVVTRGTATSSEGTLSTPFSGTACLGFEFAVTERQLLGAGLPWFYADLDDGVATVPFSLTDAEGALPVDPSARRFRLDTDSSVVTVRASERPPERIQRFVDVRDGLAVAGWMAAVPGLGTRRYVERRITPGEQYLIAGKVETREGRPTLGGDLVITDRSVRGLVFSRLWEAAAPLVIGGLFCVVGLLGVLW